MKTRRVTPMLLAIVITLGLSSMTSDGAPTGAPAGFDASWCGQSGYPTAHVGDTVALQTCFSNIGTTTWIKGASTEVVLGVCVCMPAPQLLACNVQSPYADWAVNWVSPKIYAQAASNSVTPGALSFFNYAVKVPAGTSPGDYYFTGELLHRATAIPVHPVGYYQVVHVVP
ncbi:MAG: hypothetical protein AABM40_04675 [Chloroflexota bacterium]